MQQVEREVKFALDERAPFPSLHSIGSLSAKRTYDLEATYLDTPDLDLYQHRCTLRRRTGGTDAGWHLKQPRADGSRLETHAPLAAGPAPSRVPASLRKLLKEIVGAKPLIPIAVMNTQRTECDLMATDGSIAALVSDDLVSVGSWQPHTSTPSDRQQWRELEVELAGEHVDPTILTQITELWAHEGVHLSKAASKIGAFLDARSTSSVQSAEHLSAGEVLLAYLIEQVGQIQNREAAVIVDEPSAVHKSRVAVRRLRSALKTARPLFQTERIEPLRGELRWWAGVLGGPRDAEVMRDRLLTQLNDLPEADIHGPVAERLEHELMSGHDQAHALVVRELSGERYTALMTSLAELLTSPPFLPVATKSAVKQLPRLMKRAAKKVDQSFAHSEQVSKHEREHWLHETRKTAKAARYLAESLVPVFGADATDLATRYEAVTEAFGEMQDTVVSAERLKEIKASARKAAEPLETYQLLIKKQRQGRKPAIAAGVVALKETQREDVRHWFHS